MEKKNKGKSITLEQRRVMVQLIQECPALNTNKFSGPHGKQTKVRKWKELAEKLNSMPGSQKSEDKWHKSFQDWKSKVKRKALHVRQHAGGTGGGPPVEGLTDLEEICSKEFLHDLLIEGDLTVEDPLETKPTVQTNDDTSEEPVNSEVEVAVNIVDEEVNVLSVSHPKATSIQSVPKKAILLETPKTHDVKRTKFESQSSLRKIAKRLKQSTDIKNEDEQNLKDILASTKESAATLKTIAANQELIAHAALRQATALEKLVLLIQKTTGFEVLEVEENSD